MPGGTLSAIGNIQMLQAIQTSITPAASVTAGSSITSTYTITGLGLGDVVVPAFQAAITAPLSADAIWVSAANTLSIQWSNASAATSSASPTAVTTVLLVARADRVSTGISSFPNGIY